MPRPTIEDKPLDNKERRQRSNSGKIQRGERRLNNWISATASAALDELTAGDERRGILTTVLEAAIINEAKRRRGEKIDS